jgi:rod shape-determining protein MreC
LIKPGRIFIGAFVLLVAIAAIPVPKADSVRAQSYSALKAPLAATSGLAQTLYDLTHFHQNAKELRSLKGALDHERLAAHETQELLLENQRLTQMLELRKSLPPDEGKVLIARVIARSPGAWNRVLLIDKGMNQGLRVHQPVLSGRSLIGKVLETGPSVSKVLLIGDPSSRIGVLVQRTRQQGVMSGTVAGECRIKYLSVDTPLAPGDIVETAGFGGSIPKGLLVG